MEYIKLLKKLKLFDNFTEKEIGSIFDCLDMKVIKCKKNEYLFTEGDEIKNLMLLLVGELTIEKIDMLGNVNIIQKIQSGSTFGEAYLSPNDNRLLSDIKATQDSIIALLNIKKILSTCSNACSYHLKLIKNLFFDIAEKNKNLVSKMEHLSKKSIREKVISYLTEMEKKQGKNDIKVPFNRQELADFLAVDRSALSRELSKMQNEKIIKFNKNIFIIN